MRLYCSCLNVSVCVQDTSVHFQLPQPDNPAREMYESLCSECRWPSSSLACVRLSQRFPEALVVAQPELCHRHQLSSPLCTVVECLNCHTVVLAFPQNSELLQGALSFPGTAFVHPNLFCPSQDIETMGVEVLHSFLKNESFVPPEQMVFSPAFRIYVPVLQPMLPSSPLSLKSSPQEFSSLQQHVQTYLEHAQHLMSNRIAAFIEEQEKLFEEEHLRALRDRDALLTVIRQHQEAQQLQESDKSDDDDSTERRPADRDRASPALDGDNGNLAQSFEFEQSPMFRFQEDDEKKGSHHHSERLFEVEETLEEEHSEHDSEEEEQDGVKEVNLGESGTVLLPDPEVTPKLPLMHRMPTVPSAGIAIPPRRVGPVLLDHSGVADVSSTIGSANKEEPDVVFNVYSSSMPIQVPLLEADSLDLRKRAKRALVMQAYGKAAHPIRSQSTNASGNSAAVNLEGTDLPLSQSFAVPSSLSLRNPFRPE